MLSLIIAVHPAFTLNHQRKQPVCSERGVGRSTGAKSKDLLCNGELTVPYWTGSVHTAALCFFVYGCTHVISLRLLCAALSRRNTAGMSTLQAADKVYELNSNRSQKFSEVKVKTGIV